MDDVLLIIPLHIALRDLEFFRVQVFEVADGTYVLLLKVVIGIQHGNNRLYILFDVSFMVDLV